MVLTIQSIIPATGLFTAPSSTSQFPLLRRREAFRKPAISDSLHEFVKSVRNGHANEVVGVYVSGRLALPVGQQPKGNTSYVTREKDTATEFRIARQYNTVGILAHNDLAGESFANIQVDQTAVIVYGDGHLDYYMIEDIQRYQALSPTSTLSDFINQDGSKERLTAGQLFTRIYGAGNRLVFQTCIALGDEPSWGRMFIIGRPVEHQADSLARQASSFLLSFSHLGFKPSIHQVR